MTQENEELLLKDLCARLPYGVKCKYYNVYENCYEEGTILGFERKEYIVIDGECANIEEVKPYLFPLSSMTEEIMDEIYSNTGVYDIDVDSPVHIEVGTTFEDLTKIFDILHKHHIDYQNLIEKGLAFDATGLNIY